jgi:hypothetical protein
MDAETQADAFFEFIDSFHWTDRVFPEEIFYDYAMDSPVGMNKNPDAAPIDYFKKRFQSRKTRWVPANKSRVNGWQIVADYFGKDVRTGQPKLKYWPDYNGEWEQTIPLLQHDPNNPMDVLKCDIDHWADWTRYLLVGIRRRSAVERSGQSTVSYNDVYAQINKMRRCETGLR